jgi:hypothetical protein
LNGPTEDALPRGRFTYYREEIDEIFDVARAFFGRLKESGRTECEIDWLLREHPVHRGESGRTYESDDVVAGALCLGLLEPSPDGDGRFAIL